MIPIVYPIPKTRKGLKIFLIICVAISVIISIFVLINSAAQRNDLESHGKPDFNTLAQSDLTDGMYVSGNIELAMDCYAEEYDTTYGIRTSEKSESVVLPRSGLRYQFRRYCPHPLSKADAAALPCRRSRPKPMRS